MMDRRFALVGPPMADAAQCNGPPRAAGQVQPPVPPKTEKVEPPLYAPPPQPIIAESLLALQGAATVSTLTTSIEKGSTSIAVTLTFVAIAIVIGVIAAKSSKKQ